MSQLKVTYFKFSGGRGEEVRLALVLKLGTGDSLKGQTSTPSRRSASTRMSQPFIGLPVGFCA